MITNGPAPTELHGSLDEFVPASKSAYLFATSPEARTAHSDAWEARADGVLFVRQEADGRSEVAFSVEGESVTVQLRSQASLQDFSRRFVGRTIYLDMTGFGHHVWAPLLRAIAETSDDVRVVYVEPADYTQSAAPTEGEIFDLSEKIAGIAPIPGFASLGRDDEGDFHLVVLLGFEGTRFAYLLENVQPLGDRITPIIGAPGFRPEYPFYAYHGNKSALLNSRSWTRVRYVTANCPFSVFRELRRIGDSSAERLKIAPIGTKPHSLGAILFAISRQSEVEIVYDHPIRTAKRTTGAARALVYHVSPLLREAQ